MSFVFQLFYNSLFPKDLGAVAERTANFLGVKIPEDVRGKLLDHLSFQSMKNNPMVNYEESIKEKNKEGLKFIREGKSGVWAKELKEEVVERFDEKAKEALKNSEFPYYV